MKQPYGEGLASPTDPESCVISREAGHEALTEHRADGRVPDTKLGERVS
jgi:hypothetical protein